MSTSHGSFVWHELMTSDPAAAMAFYGSVVSWSVQHSPVPGMDYWMLKAGEIPVCGLMSVPEDAKASGARPMWVGYVGVDDVDAATAKAKKLGGVVYRPPQDIPDVGRFSIFRCSKASITESASPPSLGSFYAARQWRGCGGSG